MGNPFRPVQILTLPISKQKIRARRFSFMTTVVKMGLPAELTSTVLRAYGGEESLLATPETDVVKMRSLMEIIEQIVPLFLVNLTIGDETNIELDTDGCLVGILNMADVPDLDKQYIYMYGRYLLTPDEMKDKDTKKEATTEAVATFRDGIGSIDAGSGGETVQPAAEQSPSSVATEPAGIGF